jgi:glycerol uptake facilitator-like aquaporin
MTQRLGAEVLGAFALTFIAASADAGAVITADAVSPFARALAPGLVVMALIYAIGDRSGAHFNPAVTLAFTLRGLFPRGWVVPYWLAQLTGATLAGVTLVVLLGGSATAAVRHPTGVATDATDIGRGFVAKCWLEASKLAHGRATPQREDRGMSAEAVTTGA